MFLYNLINSNKTFFKESSYFEKLTTVSKEL